VINVNAELLLDNANFYGKLNDNLEKPKLLKKNKIGHECMENFDAD
jgi:hypothetical protein